MGGVAVPVLQAHLPSPTQAAAACAALLAAQQAVKGRGRAFLRPSGTEPVVRVTVEADSAELMQSTLDSLSAAVKAAAAA
jgi:phosphoglucosamine mutase